jgi:hypothetical protein
MVYRENENTKHLCHRCGKEWVDEDDEFCEECSMFDGLDEIWHSEGDAVVDWFPVILISLFLIATIVYVVSVVKDCFGG